MKKTLTFPSVLAYFTFILCVLVVWGMVWVMQNCGTSQACSGWATFLGMFGVLPLVIVFLVGLVLMLFVFISVGADKFLAVLALSPIVVGILVVVLGVAASTIRKALPFSIDNFLGGLIVLTFIAYTALAVFSPAWRVWETIAERRKATT